MTQNTSSPKSYNYLALRGGNVDDQEFVDMFNLDPAVAYTPEINTAMLRQSYNDNLAAGVDEKKAMQNMKEAERDIKKMLARKGMLK